MPRREEVQVRRAAERFVSRGPGLTSRHSFSFGEHYDPLNVSYSSLLAHNEDVVEVARGYEDHPHRNTEIVTWVLAGALQSTATPPVTGAWSIRGWPSG